MKNEDLTPRIFFWAASSWIGKLSINISYDISVIQKEKANRIAEKMKQRLMKAMDM